MMRVYEYVCKHFLGTISFDAAYDKTKIKISVGGFNFHVNGISNIKPGFTEIMHWLNIGE